jgi:outer membrane receptor protein involved in Fe transport
VFDEEWTDMQTSAQTANGLYSFITNAGKARIRGTEVELNAVPYRGLSLSAGVGYTDAKLTQNQSTAAVLVTAATGRAGDRIPNTPLWTASSSAEYKWPLADALNGLLRADFAYTGDEHATFAKTDPNYTTYGGFGSVNLRAGIQADHWEASFFCQNASNRVGSTSVSNGNGFRNLSFGIPPRTMGLMVRYAFE